MHNRKVESYVLYLPGSARTGVEVEAMPPRFSLSLSISVALFSVLTSCSDMHLHRVTMKTPAVPDTSDLWCLHSWQVKGVARSSGQTSM